MAIAEDDLKTPALVWVVGCAIGGAGGMEISAAMLSALENDMIGGPPVIWQSAAGVAYGFVLALCQWVAMRRFGRPPPFLAFSGVTLAGAVFATLVVEAAHVAWGSSLPALAATLGLGGLAGAFVGAIQAVPLAKRGMRPLRWILGSAVGWACGAYITTALLPVNGPAMSVGDAASAGAVVGAMAGAVLGICTLNAARDLRRASVR